VNGEVGNTVTRSDPDTIDSTLKEAVAHGILGSVFQRLSGAGQVGFILKGEKPSRRLTSAFLMPANPNETTLDDETSPTRITGTGFDFMIRADSTGTVRVSPQFAIYVRILPAVEELTEEGISFRLTSEMDRNVRQSIRGRERELWNENKERLAGDRNHPEWVQLRAEITREVYDRFGVYEQSRAIAVEESDEADGTLEDVFEIRGFIVRPGDETYPSSQVVRPERPMEKWLRLPVNCPELEFELGDTFRINEIIARSSEDIGNAIDNALNLWLDSDDQQHGGKNWAYPRGRTFTSEEVAVWERTLSTIREETATMSIPDRRSFLALPDLNITWAVTIKQDWSDTTRRVVHVALENRSSRPSRYISETDESVFQVELTCRVPLEAHTPMRLDRVRSSYRYNRYLQYSALGFNCGVRERLEEGNIALECDWMPKYGLPKIEPSTHGIDCNFSTLVDPNRSINAIADIAVQLSNWVNGLDIDVGDGLYDSEVAAIEQEQEQYNKDLAAWTREAVMIQRGVDQLTRSNQFDSSDQGYIPFRAWLLMNQTMRRLTLGQYDSWRLFQLAFIIASLPSLITRMAEYSSEYDPSIDDATTLLYFATGGGKSEAFFGLLVYSLFLDRLRGKSVGVTAMLRYPLRLLTVQQAQRASKVLAMAEMVRRENHIEGAPFSIGFWVGSSNTPNNHGTLGVTDVPFIDEVDVTEEELRRTNRKYEQAVSDWLKLPKCPFCNGMTGLRRTRTPNQVLRDGILGHVCVEQSCDWNTANTEQFPLPFYIVDTDIYSIVPSVLLGTIDKLALIGQSPRTIMQVFGMFGFAAWQDQLSGRFVCPTPQEFENESQNINLLAPVYAEGEFAFFDPFPSLLIQDEVHLLEESLGTFAGLFETTLFEVYNRLASHLPSVARSQGGSTRMPKIIAATATVSDPERQVENLYQRQLIQFPYPGPRLYESFYATPDLRELTDDESSEDVEARSFIRRIYTTVLTNGKPHTTASISVLSAFHLQITFLFESLVNGDQAAQESARISISQALFEGIRLESYRNAIEAGSIADIATLVDLHRIALTYVTNKKGGDQILAAESDQVNKDHVREGLQLSNFVKRLITGSVDAGLIQQVIEDAENRPEPGMQFHELDSSLRSIVATSAISHGVDVEELNSMFFAGMPSDIAEYIQASSRVGRAHVGFSLLLPVPQRKRDRYIVETHDIFHRFLERMIQPPAIDRWAENALARVVPSFFQTYLISTLAIPQLIAADDSFKYRVPSYGKVSDVKNAAADPVAFRDGIVHFILGAVGLDTNYCPQNSDFYVELIQLRVRRLLDDLQEPDMENLLLRDFFDVLSKRSPETLEKPMTSLRDVDVSGYLVPAPAETGGPRAHLNDEQMAELMRCLRRGGGGFIGADGA